MKASWRSVVEPSFNLSETKRSFVELDLAKYSFTHFYLSQEVSDFQNIHLLIAPVELFLKFLLVCCLSAIPRSGLDFVIYASLFLLYRNIFGILETFLFQVRSDMNNSVLAFNYSTAPDFASA